MEVMGILLPVFGVFIPALLLPADRARLIPIYGGAPEPR